MKKTVLFKVNHTSVTAMNDSTGMILSDGLTTITIPLTHGSLEA